MCLANEARTAMDTTRITLRVIQRHGHAETWTEEIQTVAQVQMVAERHAATTTVK